MSLIISSVDLPMTGTPFTSSSSSPSRSTSAEGGGGRGDMMSEGVRVDRWVGEVTERERERMGEWDIESVRV